MLAPDVVTLGNHEVDYGIAHLLFLEKCARFPIINANMYITTNHHRMFRPYTIVQTGGLRVLFIGVLTQKVLSATRQDPLIGSLVDVQDAAAEVGRICNTFRTEDIDLTVLLTHIGIEEDKALAEALDPRWGVDLIIGGHSHTLLEEPCVANGIPIVQAACGTDQIGRFDITVDTATNSVCELTWDLVPIDAAHCPRDPAIEQAIAVYKTKTDAKYDRFITRLADRYTHPVRNRETQLGKLLADAMRDALGVDLVFLGSGSIRGEALGPIVLYRDLAQIYPYNDEFYRIDITGAQLRHMLRFILREDGGLGG
jgi:5'-nucleotidase